jgi:hypothetical protein
VKEAFLRITGSHLQSKAREARYKLLGNNRIRMCSNLQDYCMKFRLATVEVGTAAFGPDTLVDLFLGGLPDNLLTRMGADRNGAAWNTWEDAEKAAVAADTFIKTAAQLQTFKQRAHAAPLQAFNNMQFPAQAKEPVSMEESEGANTAPPAGQQEGAQLGAMGSSKGELVYGRNGTLDPSIDCHKCGKWGHKQEVCPRVIAGEAPVTSNTSKGFNRRGGYNNHQPGNSKRGRDDDRQGGSGGYGGGYNGSRQYHNQGYGGNRQYNQGGQRQYNNHHGSRGGGRSGGRFRQGRVGAIAVPYPEQY